MTIRWFYWGKATFGSNRSQELADDKADDWELIMSHNVACFDATTSFLARATPLDRVEDYIVILSISPEDVSAALKRLKRGIAARPDENHNKFYRYYADALTPVLAAMYARWLKCSVLPASFGNENIQFLKNTSAPP